MLQLLLIVPLLGALYLIAVYIQPIGFVLVNFSELFNYFFLHEQKVVLTCLLALPVAPHDVKPRTGLLTKAEKEAFSLSQELKDTAPAAPTFVGASFYLSLKFKATASYSGAVALNLGAVAVRSLCL